MKPLAAFLVTIGLLAVPAVGSAQGEPDARLAPLAERLDEYLTRLEIYGFSGSVLVAHENEVVLERGYGLAEDETGMAVKPQSPLLIGSLSKQFTAAAILKLEMDGRLSTADTVGRFYPSAPQPLAGVTVHELLTHTSGLPYLPENFMEVKSREAVLSEMLELPIDPSRAGSYFYSSPGYTLLAGLVERASGTDYETYLRNALFEPVGMSATGFVGESRWEAAPRIHSYSGGVDEGPLQEFPALPKALGAGSVISTVGDLYRWERALRGDRILSGEARRKLFAPHVPVQGPVSHGYGWNIVTTSRGTTLIVHPGDLGGYNSELRRYSEEDVTIILLSNRRVNGQGWRGPVMNNLSLIVAGKEHAAPPPVQRVPEASLEPLVGRYALPQGESIEVAAGDGVLRVGASGQSAATAMRAMPSELNAAVEAMTESANAVAAILETGALEGLRPYLHPSVPFEDARAGIAEALDVHRAESGALRTVEVLGTTAASPTMGTTALRLVHEDLNWLLHVGWVGGRILGLDTATELPHATTFAALGDGRFAAYDPFTGRVVAMSFETPAEGMPASVLEIGHMRARREDR